MPPVRGDLERSDCQDHQSKHQYTALIFPLTQCQIEQRFSAKTKKWEKKEKKILEKERERASERGRESGTMEAKEAERAEETGLEEEEEGGRGEGKRERKSEGENRRGKRRKNMALASCTCKIRKELQ